MIAWFASLASATPLTGAPAPHWPLEAGTRWTFTDAGGAERLVLTALGDGRVEVRGPSVFWGGSGFTLTEDAGGWRVPATASYLGDDPKPEPWRVLQGPLVPGRSWTVTERRDGVPFSFEVDVVGPESVSLPTGPVDAWHLRYTLLAHLGTEHDFDLWVADGLGPVRILRTAESTMGRKTPEPADPLTLARFERRGPPQPVTDAPHDALQAEVVATGPGRVGQPFPLRFAVRDVGAVPVDAIVSLDASDVGWRYPKIGVEFVDPRGHVVEREIIGRCGLMNPLTAADLRELRPGEALDPFGPGSFSHEALSFTPDRRGTWTVRFTYDTSGATGWDPVDPDAPKLVPTVPAGAYRAETTVEVR
jgi:hypothetical protein